MDQQKINKKVITQLIDHERRIRALETDARSAEEKGVEKQTRTDDSDNLILAIVNKIGECDESEEIQNKVLDQRSTEGKILLCFYISHKYFKNTWLTTGDIEKITSGLGTKIAIGNVSNKIKGELRQYLESGAVRKQGQPTPYRLNRKGVKRFEEMLRAEKD
ncbi:MAG: hypothetical protein ABSF47_01640 [Minisyncoccia bacterium]|jgi:hypothetical protein